MYAPISTPHPSRPPTFSSPCPAHSSSSATNTVPSHPLTSTFSTSSRSVTTTFGSASLNTAPTRSAGCPTSTGTYIPPAFNTPSSTAICSAPLLRHTTTTVSGPTPNPRRRCATRFARAFNSSYVHLAPPLTNAIAFPRRSTCSSNFSCTNFSPAYTPSVAFHSCNKRSHSSPPSTSTSSMA